MFLITRCLVSLVEFSTLGNGNETRYDYTAHLVRDSSPSLALVLLVTSCCHGWPSHGCSLQLREILWHSLAAQWLSVHSPGCADSSWDSFRRMAALLSYDSTCPTSSQVGMLAQDQCWKLSILQKKTPIFPHPDFHINSHRWLFIDTVRWDWISDVVYGLNHAEGWTLRLSSGSMGQWTEDTIIFVLEFQSKQSS